MMVLPVNLFRFTSCGLVSFRARALGLTLWNKGTSFKLEWKAGA